MTRYAFIDTETDSLSPSRHVWEIGIITVDDVGTEHERAACTHLFLPLDVSRSDGQALAIGRYWQRHPSALAVLADAPAPAMPVTSMHEAARRVLRATHGAILVGINPAFDTQALERILRTACLAPTWDYRLIDMRALAMGYLLGRRENVDELASSDDLSIRCGVAPPDGAERHTALGDAGWAQRWFFSIASDRDRGAEGADA